MISVQDRDGQCSKLPLVTVAIPSFNHANFIRQAVESVIAQDYINIELIIIDDGSDDNSLDLIYELIPACINKFSRFEFIARENSGFANCMNIALNWGNGVYFAVLDSDDVYKKNKISELVPMLENDARLAGVFSGNEAIDEFGQVFGQEYSETRDYSFQEIMLHKHILSTPGQLLRRSAILSVGGYNNNLEMQDWYLWLRLSEIGYVLRCVPNILVQYRYHNMNYSKNRKVMYEQRLKTLSYFRQHDDYNAAISVINIWAAIDFSSVSKLRSFSFLLQALVASPSCLFSRYFAKGVLRWFTPCIVVRHSEWLKARWPRAFAYLPRKF